VPATHTAPDVHLPLITLKCCGLSVVLSADNTHTSLDVHVPLITLVCYGLCAGNRQRTKGTIVTHMDPHLPYVPTFLVSWVLAVLSPYAWRSIQRVMAEWFDPAVFLSLPPRKRSPHAGTHLQRIASQPELYAVIQQRMEQCLSPQSHSLH
jgi:hypothetical protein